MEKSSIISHSDQTITTRPLPLHQFHSPLHSTKPQAFSPLPIKSEKRSPREHFAASLLAGNAHFEQPESNKGKAYEIVLL